MKIGSLDISAFKVGATDCSIYLGNTKLYPTGGHDYSRDYFTIVSEANGNTIGLGSSGSSAPSITVSVSTDDGQTWTEFSGGTIATINTGDKLLLKGINNMWSSGKSQYNYITTTSAFHVEGNIMSLLYGDEFVNQTSLNGKTYCFRRFLYNNTNVISAENLVLPATTLADYSYSGMFSGCGNLTATPELSATTLATNCYEYMFENCTSLTTAPELPATTLADYCYQGIFKGCSSLTAAPELPATTLAESCYRGMFEKCTSLTTAPELPATTLVDYCYRYMFNGCTSLTTAPELPATTLVDECYRDMFSGCTSLNYIKCLATDINAYNCTSNWVNGVAASGTFVKDASMTSWTTGINGIPNNWIVENSDHDYSLDYFTIVSEANNNTVSIVAENSAPSITVSASTDNGQTWTEYTGGTIATINTGDKLLLKGVNNVLSSSNGYNRITATDAFHVEGNTMSLLFGDNFSGQTSLSGRDYAFKGLFYSAAITLTSAEHLILPATTLAVHCYSEMFSNCKSLTTAPELPATTLASNCYFYMFYECTSLTTAPELPATTLTYECYCGMFSYCTSLTTAPELPATTLAERCYLSMFNGCTSLNYIKCLATDISASDCTFNWTFGVAATGTFVKDPNMTSWTTGFNGIPNNWVVEDAPIHFTIVSKANNNTVSIEKSSSSAPSITVSASTDGGQTWTEYTGGTIATLNTGDRVLLKGVNTTFGSSGGYNIITSTSSFDVEGDIMSLLYGDNFSGQTSLSGRDYAFQCLFVNATALMSAENLILSATTLENSCYHSMFRGCSSLTAAPKLPATTLANRCYQQMFDSCSSLTAAPALPATNLSGATQCYTKMFQGCSSLTTAPALPATTLEENCYSAMFSGCTSLTSAQVLPAATLAQGCYTSMFNSCISLTAAPELPATTLAQNCYSFMFYGCTSLNYIKCLATDISASNCTNDWTNGVASTGTFVKDPDMSSWTTGVNGIPDNWTVEGDTHDYSLDYFTIVSEANNNTVSIVAENSAPSITVSVSTDDGQTWTEYTGGTIATLNTGDKVLLKGVNNTLTSSNGNNTIVATASFHVEGNTMSLLFGDNFSGQTSLSSRNYALAYLFKGVTTLTSAENMILPATTLAERCYTNMFEGCTSLTTAPELPATTLTKDCYNWMFYGCTSLTTAPELSATTLASFCYSAMFSGCTSLTTAPELPATSLVDNCYRKMFKDCSSLNYIKCLARQYNANSYTFEWVSNVAATGTFVKDPNMSSWGTGVSGIPSGWTVTDNT